MPTERTTAWPTILLLGAMYALLLGNAALYWTAPLPLPLHVLISALAIHLAFTIWHEAVHGSVSSRRPLNDAVGILGALPYMAPFYVERWLHLQHHALLNREDDPNRVYTDGALWTLPLRYLRALRYAREKLAQDPRTSRQRSLDRAMTCVVLGLYGVAIWQGVFLDVLLLWFVPIVLAKLVMDWYVNWLPHVGLPPDRYLGTRVVDLAWLTPLVLSHNYHAVHHLWPNIPWYRYKPTFDRKRTQLEERGVPIVKKLWGFEHGPVAPSPGDSRPA